MIKSVEILVVPESQSAVPRFPRFLLSLKACKMAAKWQKNMVCVAAAIRTWVTSLENCVGNQLGK
jgi:hypothetical protein